MTREIASNDRGQIPQEHPARAVPLAILAWCSRDGDRSARSEGELLGF